MSELPLFDDEIPGAIPGAHFNGPEYVPERDHVRLAGQMRRIFDLMKDGEWRTLENIRATTGDPPASISAQLRHLRKVRFGSHEIERRGLGHGLFQYRLIVNIAAETI